MYLVTEKREPIIETPRSSGEFDKSVSMDLVSSSHLLSIGNTGLVVEENYSISIEFLHMF